MWKIETVLALSSLAGKPLPGGGIDSVVKTITVDPGLARAELMQAVLLIAMALLVLR